MQKQEEELIATRGEALQRINLRRLHTKKSLRLTPLYILGTFAFVLAIVLTNNESASLHSSVSGNSAGNSSSASSQELDTKAPDTPSTTNGGTTMSQENTADNGNSSVSGSTNSSDVHASINASNDGTTTTINGVTQQTPAGQPVDRSEQYQTDNGSVQVHMSSHSSSSADGSNTSSSQHINLNVNSKSGSQGVQSP